MNQPRFSSSASVKQIVQVRAAPLSSQQQQQQQQQQQLVQPKETGSAITSSGHARSVQTVNSVASSIAKTLPGKANVIVLHKNSPLVKNMQQQTAANKASIFNIYNIIITYPRLWQLLIVNWIFLMNLGSWSSGCE